MKLSNKHIIIIILCVIVLYFILNIKENLVNLSNSDNVKKDLRKCCNKEKQF